MALDRSLGGDWPTYIANKRRGGDNGAKGVLYEQLFAAHRLAQELSAYIASPGRGLPFLEMQAEAVVDDLVVKWGASPATYYQCKNVLGITWTGGTHPLDADFAAQIKLSTHLGEAEVRTTLVVPSGELSQALSDSIPAAIADHTNVVSFPYCDGSVNRLVLEEAGLRGALAELSRVDAPTDDELTIVLSALMHGIRLKDGRGTCEELLAGAQSLSPNLVRLMPKQVADFKLMDGFEEVLAKIDGLMYRLSRGFFHWEAFGTSGVFSQNCLSPSFERFQRRVIAQKPTSFDEFEELL